MDIARAESNRFLLELQCVTSAVCRRHSVPLSQLKQLAKGYTFCAGKVNLSCHPYALSSVLRPAGLP